MPRWIFELRKARIRARDPDIGRQQQLNTECHTPSVGSSHNRGRPRFAVVSPRVARILGVAQAAGGERGPDLREVKPTGEVIAVGEQHAAAQILVPLDSSYARPSWIKSSMLKALRLAGRFNPISNTCPRRSKVRIASSAFSVIASAFRLMDWDSSAVI